MTDDKYWYEGEVGNPTFVSLRLLFLSESLVESFSVRVRLLRTKSGRGLFDAGRHQGMHGQDYQKERFGSFCN